MICDHLYGALARVLVDEGHIRLIQLQDDFQHHCQYRYAKTKKNGSLDPLNVEHKEDFQR